MADQAFLTWPYEVVSSGAQRTVMERGTDVFNIRDYFHTGDTNWQPAIQRAVDAALVNGGTVFFPPGEYGLDRHVYIGASGGNIRLVGCGGHDGAQGSALTMSVKDYILYGSFSNDHGFNIGLIQGISFKNSYNGPDPISIEPPNTDLTTAITATAAGTGSVVRVTCNPFIGVSGAGGMTLAAGQEVIIAGNNVATNGKYRISATSGTWIELQGTTFPGAWTNTGTVAFSGDGSGCVYLGGGIGNVVRDCYFGVSTGVGYFNGGFCGTVETCNIQGNYGGGAASTINCIGIMSRSLAIRGGKIGSCGTGIAMFKGHSSAEFMDIELCGIGILVGQNPIPYYDGNEDDNPHPAGNNVCAKPGVSINHIGFEACAVAAMDLKVCFGEVRNISHHSSGQIGIPNYGINCDGALGVEFHRLDIDGAYNIAGVNVGGAQTCVFRYCQVVQSGGTGTPWKLPTPLAGYVMFDACSSNNAPFDGGVPYTSLPAAGGSIVQQMLLLCSDSNAPAWTGTVSNIGKPITGGGSNRVLARWNGSAWCIAG